MVFLKNLVIVKRKPGSYEIYLTQIDFVSEIIELNKFKTITFLYFACYC